MCWSEKWRLYLRPRSSFRFLVCLAACGLAFLSAMPLAMILNPAGVIFVCIYFWAFPAGLVVVLPAIAEGSRWETFFGWTLVGVGWLIYVTLIWGLLRVRRAAAFGGLFLVLCLLLAANTAGCRQIWRENTYGSTALTSRQRQRDDLAVQNDGLLKLTPARQIAAHYPETDHYLCNFKYPTQDWNTEAYFEGRFILRMVVRVNADYSTKTIRLAGEPKFILSAVESIEMDSEKVGLTRFDVRLERKFTVAEWDKFVAAGYDLAALGIPRDEIHPVEHFPEFVRGERRPHHETWQSEAGPWGSLLLF
jgi:hypothetical protein